MPSPSAVDGADDDDDDDEEEQVGDREEEEASQRTSEQSWGRRGWSEAEWRQWNSFYAWGPGPSGGGGSTQGNGAGPSSSIEGSAAPTAPQVSQGDPWWTSQGGDPWIGGDDRRHGGGGQDKIQVLEYSGEDDRDGLKAKGCIRKVEAWRRVTRLSRGKQALMLYNSLSGGPGAMLRSWTCPSWTPTMGWRSSCRGSRTSTWTGRSPR